MKVTFIETTQTKYNALDSPDIYTLYNCTDTERCFLGEQELTNEEDIQSVMAAISVVETKADSAQTTANQAVTAAATAQSTADSAIKNITANSPLSSSTSDGTTTLTHSTSGASSGSYGDSSAQTPSFGGAFKVNYETINDTGHTTAISSHNVTIPNTTATTSTAGLMSANDKTKLDGIATGATDNTGTITGITTSSPLSGSGTSGSVALSHATSGVSSGTYGPTANSSPSSGGTFSVPSVTVDTYGHVTGANSRTITLPTTLGTSTVGSGTKHIYLSSGTATASSSTVGSTARPLYLNSGTMTALSASVGSKTSPVYLDSGTITECDSLSPQWEDI